MKTKLDGIKLLTLSAVSVACMMGTNAYAVQHTNLVNPVVQTSAPGAFEKIMLNDEDWLEVTSDQKKIYDEMSEGAQEVFRKAMISQLKTHHAQVAYPGTSIATPSGFGAQWGSLSAGISYDSDHWGDDTQDNDDADFSFDLGLGDAREYVGADMAVTVGSINPTDGGFAERGSFSPKLHHTFAEQHIGVGFGVSSLWSWGGDETYPSYYGVVTKVISLDPHSIENSMPLTFSLGAGNDTFVDGAAADPSVYDDRLGVFGSIALQVTSRVSLITDESGKVYSAGFSVVPNENWPLSMTFAAYDLTEHLTSHNISLFGSIGYSYTF